jgi:hypothetical protein
MDEAGLRLKGCVKMLRPFTQATKVQAKVTSLGMKKASDAKRRRRRSPKLVQQEKKEKRQRYPCIICKLCVNFIGVFVISYEAV